MLAVPPCPQVHQLLLQFNILLTGSSSGCLLPLPPSLLIFTPFLTHLVLPLLLMELPINVVVHGNLGEDLGAIGHLVTDDPKEGLTL